MGSNVCRVLHEPSLAAVTGALRICDPRDVAPVPRRWVRLEHPAHEDSRQPGTAGARLHDPFEPGAVERRGDPDEREPAIDASAARVDRVCLDTWGTGFKLPFTVTKDNGRPAPRIDWPVSSRRSGWKWATTSSSFAVREAGAWLRPRQWRRRAIPPVTTSLAALKGRSTRTGTGARSEVGRRRVFPGYKARAEETGPGTGKAVRVGQCELLM